MAGIFEQISRKDLEDFSEEFVVVENEHGQRGLIIGYDSQIMTIRRYSLDNALNLVERDEIQAFRVADEWSAVGGTDDWQEAQSLLQNL